MQLEYPHKSHYLTQQPYRTVQDEVPYIISFTPLLVLSAIVIVRITNRSKERISIIKQQKELIKEVHEKSYDLKW